MLSRSETLVKFNQGATGREAGTSPERAAAHPRSAKFSRQDNHDRRRLEDYIRHYITLTEIIKYHLDVAVVIHPIIAIEQWDSLPSQPTSPGRAPASAAHCHSCP